MLGPVADAGAAVGAASRALFLGDGCEQPGGPGLSAWREAGGSGWVRMPQRWMIEIEKTRNREVRASLSIF